MTHIISTHPAVLNAIEECEREIEYLENECNKKIADLARYQNRLDGEKIKLNLLKGFPVKKKEIE